MTRRLLLAVLLAPALARAQGGTLSGPTGLLTVPTAGVVDEGVVRVGASAHDALPPRGGDPTYRDGVQNYLFTIGFLPGLELGGRLAQSGDFDEGPNDLSFNAKYAYRFDNGFAVALGGQDIGGEARNFRSRYLVATLPWRTLAFTAGYDWGPDVLDGPIGGIEWRPWPVLGLYAEYDAEEVNPGLKLESPPLWAGMRLGANAGYRGATDEVEGGIELTIPLGRSTGPSPGALRAPASPRERGEAKETVPLPIQTEPLVERPLAPSPPLFADGLSLRAALEALGFESVRTGTRGDAVLVVELENRRYNHSAADGLGLALGTIAMRAPSQVERVELTLRAYGVPQVEVAVSPRAYREFLRSGVAPPGLLEARYTDGPADSVGWHNNAAILNAAELVLEPVLRTFAATEFGVFDAGLGARARLTVPLDNGVVAHLGAQVPLARTDDFRDGENFDGFGPEAGLDLLMVQHVQKFTPGWTSMLSLGLAQVFQVDLRVAGMEHVWTSPEGGHRLNAKAMLMDAAVTHRVLLAGYTWFDPARRFSAGVTGGRFYANDTGVRFELNRYFDDTIAGVFLKVESDDNMAGGFQISLPLTPRRDAPPTGVQVKGARRWGHSLQTTLNRADRTNALKPLLLYEPVLDFDLRRDFLDSNRLGPAWLRDQLPCMREAYGLWGAD